MKKILSLSTLFLTVMVSCKKDPGFTVDVPGGNTKVPACQVLTDKNDQNLLQGNEFTLTYDGDGKLTSVAAANSGTAIGTVTVAPQEIVRKTSAATETFDFTKNIFTGQPDGYTYSNSSNTNQNKTVKLTFNSNAKVIEAKFYDATNTLVSTRDFVYNADGDLTSFSYQYTGSPVNTITATGFDKNNSPFSGQTGTQFLFYAWDYENTNDFTYVFLHLSRHNLTGYQYNYPNGSQTADYQYTYNEQNFPLTIFESITNVYKDVAQPLVSFNWTYSYNCK